MSEPAPARGASASLPGWLAITAVLLLLGTAPLAAQTSVVAAGGALLPLRGMGEVTRTGFLVHAGAMVGSGPGRTFGGEAFYGQASHLGAADRSELFGGQAIWGYGFGGPAAASLIVLGGVGGMVHGRSSRGFPDLTARKVGLVVSLGAVLDIPLGPIRGQVRGSWMTGLGPVNTEAFPTELASVGAGVAVPLG